MSARATAVSLALVISASPGALEAGDLEGQVPETVAPSPPSTPAGAGSPLRLAWLDARGVAPGVGGVARAESRQILEEAGLEVAWRRASGEEEGRPGEIRVVLDDRLRMDRRSRRLVLGSTPVGFRGHPFVRVHVPSVRASLGLAPRGSVRPLELRRRRTVGLALGRVIAHEIIHAIAPSLPHGGELMSASLTHQQLTSPTLSAPPAATRAAREGLHRRPAASPPDRRAHAAEGAVEAREGHPGGRTLLP